MARRTANADQAAARLRSAGCQFQGKFGDASGWMIGNAGKHVGEIVLRVEGVELGALDR